MAGTRANAAGRGGGRGGGQGEAVGRGQARGSARGRGGGGSRGGARGRGGGPKSRLSDSDGGEGGGAEQPEDGDLEDEERSSSSDDDNLGRFEAVAMVERRGVATRDEEDTEEGGLFTHPPERERTDAAAMGNFVASNLFLESMFGMTQEEITQGINDGDLPHGKAGLYPSSIDRLKERFDDPATHKPRMSEYAGIYPDKVLGYRSNGGKVDPADVQVIVHPLPGGGFIVHLVTNERTAVQAALLSAGGQSGVRVSSSNVFWSVGDCPVSDDVQSALAAHNSSGDTVVGGGGAEGVGTEGGGAGEGGRGGGMGLSEGGSAEGGTGDGGGGAATSAGGGSAEGGTAQSSTGAPRPGVTSFQGHPSALHLCCHAALHRCTLFRAGSCHSCCPQALRVRVSRLLPPSRRTPLELARAPSLQPQVILPQRPIFPPHLLQHITFQHPGR